MAEDDLLLDAANMFAELALQVIEQELDRVDPRRVLCVEEH